MAVSELSSMMNSIGVTCSKFTRISLERKIRIGAVSYLNTKPLLYGLENGPIKDDIELILDYPANLVNLLSNDEIDIGLIPVGALPGLGDYHIVSDYCIGTEGEVASVAVFSEVPMDQIETVILDYQSRTSVMLCKILFEHHWKKSVQFIHASDETYINQIKGNVAGLVIGDRALKIRSKFNFIYDLGMGWKEMTGLPFVFAIWVVKKQIDLAFLEAFNEANFNGLNKIKSVLATVNFDYYDLKEYFMKNISYDLTLQKRQAINSFFSLLIV
jgi:chorismate dehydratase